MLSQQFGNKKLPDFSDLLSHRYCEVYKIVCNYSITDSHNILNMHHPSTMKTFTPHSHYYSLHMHISKADNKGNVIREITNASDA